MRPRVIPVLLLDKSRRFVKTRKFTDEVYVGDPFNVIRIFNEKEVDEICVLDVDASTDGRSPDIGFIGSLASESFMPLSYGGGITSLEECEQLFAVGVEKIVIGSLAPGADLVRKVSQEFGSQSVSVSVDVTFGESGWEVRTRRGKVLVSGDPLDYARKMADAGAGEILLSNIDRDGCREGYDTELISQMSAAVAVPVVALGGAGSCSHLIEGLAAGASAVASGSAFVFIGRLRAVLITYPTTEEFDRRLLIVDQDSC